MVALHEADSPQQAYARRVAAILRDLHRLEGSTYNDMLSSLREIRRDVVDQLAAASDGGGWPAYRLRGLRDAIDRASEELARRMGRSLSDGSRIAFRTGAAVSPESLVAAGITLNVRPDVPTDALAIATQLQADLVRHVSTEFRTRAQREVTRVVAGGQSPWDAQLAIRRLLATEPLAATGRRGTIASRAEAIARTEINKTFALADQARDAEIADQQPALRKVWASAHDGRVRASHAAAHARYAAGADPGPIALGADFIVGGHRASAPHDPRLPASEVVRCRCVRAFWHPAWG